MEAIGGEYLYKLMFSMYYPAVLGSVFYSFLQYLNQERNQPATIKLYLTFLVVLHFSLDFLAIERLEASAYSGISFGIDLLVIIAMFKAFFHVRLASPEREIDSRELSQSLGAAYLLYVAWTLHNRAIIDPFGVVIAFDAAFAALYLLIGYLRPRLVPLCLTINCISYLVILVTTRVGVSS